MSNIRIRFLPVLVIVAARMAMADGTTDISIDPNTGVTISKPGSYKLVSDVTMTADVVAINVTSTDVTLDLGGHTITAVAGSGTSGVTALTQFSLSNGGIRHFGVWGILAGRQTSIRNVSVMFCNKNSNKGGITLSDNVVVEDCIVKGNAGPAGSATGIEVGANSRVLNNTVEDNDAALYGTRGIATGDGAIVMNNAVRGNDALGGLNPNAIGISLGKRGLARGNVCTLQQSLGTGGSAAYGIRADDGSLIESNVCADQGASDIGGAVGIDGSYSTIINNDCMGNIGLPGSNASGTGIFGSLAMIRGNRCSGNKGVGTGNGVGIGLGVYCQVTDNLCVSNVGGSTGFGWGMRVSSAGTYVANNMMIENSTAAIVYFNSNYGRIQANQMRQSVGIDTTHGVNPPSIGTGDLANISF